MVGWNQRFCRDPKPPSLVENPIMDPHGFPVLQIFFSKVVEQTTQALTSDKTNILRLTDIRWLIWVGPYIP